MLRFRQLGLFILVIFILLITHWQSVEDWLNLPLQPPSPVVERLALTTAMTRPAQRLFYRQNPSIESPTTVLGQCNVPEKTIILGCYSRQNGIGKIIIQQISDSRLQGMMEVTAAHEMLHAAYANFSDTKRQELARHLERAAQNVSDKRLASVLKSYQTKDLDLYHNELHSHLGTELANLGDLELERHYQRYFSDRTRVLTFAQQSGQALRQLEQQAETLKLDIDRLEIDLERRQQQLQQIERATAQRSQQLDALKVQLNQTKTAAEAAFRRGDLKAQDLAEQFERQKAEFNQQVDDHNRQVEAQNQQVETFNAKVSNYKQKVATYNAIARESREILDSLKGENP